MQVVQPIVLVGGRSRRFGRDKLREVVGREDGRDVWLVDRAIGALRAVFGRCVLLVGECDPLVAARGDAVLTEAQRGAGPVGGIVAALERHAEVFVLPGDLPAVTPAVMREILAAAQGSPRAWAVLARTDRLEPCVGVYRAAALATLRERLVSGRRSLHDALAPGHVVVVDMDGAALANANTPGDL